MGRSGEARLKDEARVGSGSGRGGGAEPVVFKARRSGDRLDPSGSFLFPPQASGLGEVGSGDGNEQKPGGRPDLRVRKGPEGSGKGPLPPPEMK